MPGTQFLAGDGHIWERTWVVYPRKLTIVHPKRLHDFSNTRELILIISDAIRAHKGYYEAGVIHGNVSEENIVILEGPNKRSRKGVLVDLDRGPVFRRPERPDPQGARNV
ncbi:hypothetical protein BKA93DRAFT_827578 [Sparassis latifolia]|uniref:Fungal-type protein kinase domain-containing protein n=1 Tax=Sparassis crispa TaxID=139825 RepID=A0A401H5R8_9APHY|nr:hypothetical protein SCP_1700530 [Sparassis crispa]GBE89729.1 hypothetical protein SCP_1700530 [Sparassis crispa]